MVGHAKELISKIIRAPIVREQYALNKEGQQFFCELGIDIGEKDLLSVALRSSLNKTIAAAAAAGKHVMCCDNLEFGGDAMVMMRKNTTNCERDFVRMAEEHMQKALGHFAQMEKSDQEMKALPISEKRGYALLGVAMGEGVLAPQQATIAFKDWQGVLRGTPRHEELAEENLWGLYNCVTEGLKKGAPAQRIDRQTEAHRFFRGWLE
jgi:hypothetical protein